MTALSSSLPLNHQDSFGESFKATAMNAARRVKNTLSFTVQALAAIVFIVAHPVIGPVGSLGCLFAAAYHGLALNYHWRHSREKDENGAWISGTALINQPSKNPYANRNPGYTEKDLPRLEHERKRLYHENAAGENLKWARGLAKCTIPVVGLIWAILTELNGGGSMPMGCEGCMDHWNHETPEGKLQSHISKLKKQIEEAAIEAERNELLYSIS